MFPNKFPMKSREIELFKLYDLFSPCRSCDSTPIQRTVSFKFNLINVHIYVL